ncbi:MAG: hypothetical protein IKF78_11265 [Atopobiaceae bacterium]|nr:hypothetical protein [Atopobiaceae bacterium]
MSVSRRQFVSGAGIAAAMLLSACGSSQSQSQSASKDSENKTSAVMSSNLALDSSAWQHNADDDVYYQLGVSYCEKPADGNYETLAILVPGAYFNATDNGNGTFTCEVNKDAKVGSYTASSAPIVMPINTPGYSAQNPMSEYSSQAAYTTAGMVYVHAGCRGRDVGAPAGVADLKAAVRFLRFVANRLPGNTDRIFTFGMSGGGAQSALMGATGDAEPYEPYLSAIGAVSGASDAVYGSMDWCPITGLDVADEAYEWMMGSTRTSLSDEEQRISTGLAEAYAAWVNSAGLVGKQGATLKLQESGEGTYQAGSYYEQVLTTIDESLNNFLADTTFPYDADSAGGMGGPGGGMGNGQRPEGMGDGQRPEGMGDGQRPEGMGAPGGNMANAEQNDNISRSQNTGGVSISGTYNTAAEYIAALNASSEWVSYDQATNTAKVTSVAAFCNALKRASKGIGAFDQLDRGQGENTLFGEDGNAAHFDATLAQVLANQGSSYAADFDEDLKKKDTLGTSVSSRVSMYTPLYYILESQAGYGQSELAKHWRIRTGIEQGDTALCTELNLALGLKANGNVESVDFATVWGQGHTQAERTGTATENFISWVADCMG